MNPYLIAVTPTESDRLTSARNRLQTIASAPPCYLKFDVERITDLISAMRYLAGHGLEFDCDILALDVSQIRKQLRKEHADYYEHR